nr:MAG TPA: hypothetical protein [Caudoviricetes sp.]
MACFSTSFSTTCASICEYLQFFTRVWRHG